MTSDPEPETGEPAPDFVASHDNPAPARLAISALSVAEGRRLRCAVAPGEAGAATRGTVVLLQGRNEAIEKYFEVMADLNRRGFAVATFDWRGQAGPAASPGWPRSATSPA